MTKTQISPLKSIFGGHFKKSDVRKPYVEISEHEWAWSGLFLFSMTLTGLDFPFAILLVLIIIINRLQHNLYDFIIMFTIFVGGFALIGDETLPVKTSDIALIISVFCLFIYKKERAIKYVSLGYILYAAALLFIATFSDEKMSVQIRVLRNYLGFIYFFIPSALFANREFDIDTFFRKLMPYVLIICIYYIMDAFILRGHYFLPAAYSSWMRPSTFMHPNIHPLTGNIIRIYPPGLYLLTLAVFPICRKFRLKKWQWAVIILGMIASKTFTVISGLAVTYILFQEEKKRIMRFAVIGLVSAVSLYVVDSILPTNKYNLSQSSALRIKSSIDQIIALKDARTIEDFADFASGRIGQAIPKFELIYKYDLEWVGLGFLHPDLSRSSKYIIDNEFYSNNMFREETAAAIEISPLQVFLNTGFSGLILHFAFFIFTYLAIRKYKYSAYYLSVLFCNFWFGLGGFAGLTQFHGLSLSGLAFSVVYLAGRNEQKNRRFAQILQLQRKI